MWDVVSSTRNVSLELRSEHTKLTLIYIYIYMNFYVCTAPLYIVFISTSNAQYIFYFNNICIIINSTFVYKIILIFILKKFTWYSLYYRHAATIPNWYSEINVTFYSVTLARTIWLHDDGLRTETCWGVFNVLMCKFYICVVVGVIIEWLDNMHGVTTEIILHVSIYLYHPQGVPKLYLAKIT